MNDFRDNPDRGCAPGKKHDVIGEVRPEMFFSDHAGERKRAKRVCLDCPVQKDCHRYAVTTAQEFGVWGGLNFSGYTSRRRHARERHQADRSAAA